MCSLLRSAWIDALPDLLDHCAARWELQIGEPLEGGYLARVYACTDADSKRLVLKLSQPDLPAALEAAALRLWAGSVAASVRGYDPETNALLIDRVIPGTPLPPADKRRAIEVAARVLSTLHGARLPDGHAFPALLQAFDSYLKRTRAEAEPDAVGVGLLDQAQAAVGRLWASATETVLLHGNFIDKNLLLGPAGFVAIDPMPSVGDPCCDIGMFASYHPPARNIASRARGLAQRLDRDPSRAERWATIWAVGEACETWRDDSDELQDWVGSEAVVSLLAL